jgi:hypothetical protein
VFICNLKLYYQKLNNIKYYTIFIAFYIEILFLHRAPVELYRIVKSEDSEQQQTFSYRQMICDRKLQTPHFSVTFAQTTKIQLYIHGHWMTYFNFSDCGEDSPWSLKRTVSCHTQDMPLLGLYESFWKVC